MITQAWNQKPNAKAFTNMNFFLKIIELTMTCSQGDYLRENLLKYN